MGGGKLKAGRKLSLLFVVCCLWVQSVCLYRKLPGTKEKEEENRREGGVRSEGGLAAKWGSG